MIAKFHKSKSEAKRDIISGGMYLNNERITDPDYIPFIEDFLYGKYLVIRKGKKNYKLLKINMQNICEIDENFVLLQMV